MHPKGAAAFFIRTELPMVVRIVIRAMLVIALIATAHVIKPFSISNTTSQLMNVANAVSEYLPDETRIGFNHANFLAVSLSRSLLGGGCFEGAQANDVLATRLVPPGLTRAAKIWPPEEPVKPGRRVKPAPKRSNPSKRIDRPDNNNIATYSYTTGGGGDQILWDASPNTGATAVKASLRETNLPAATPVVLPILPTETNTALYLQLGGLFRGPHRNVCRENEVKMVATVLTTKKRMEGVKAVLTLLNAARECENQKPDGAQPEAVEFPELADTEEAETEEVEAPVEAPQPEIPQEVTEESKPEIRFSPLQCPMNPQD